MTMADYDSGDWNLMVRVARQQAEKRLADAVHAVEGYAVILDQAGHHGDALDAQQIHRALLDLQRRLGEIGGDRG